MPNKVGSRRKSQICPKGHDKDITGRTKQGGCRICRNAYVKAWKDAKPYRSNQCMWKKHGILNSDGSQFSPLDFDRLYQIQQGKCAICEIHSSELTQQLSVDHNHETGIVRGLLCVGCNTKLGIKEQLEWNLKADKYLGGSK